MNNMNNINPKMWGKNGWKFMHWITLGYSDTPTNNEKTDMRNFFNSIGNVLPCLSCRQNFLKHIKKYPLGQRELSSRSTLVEWLMNIHNEVNIITGKKLYTLDMLYNEYMNQSLIPSSWLFYLIIFIIILLITLFIRHYSKLRQYLR